MHRPSSSVLGIGSIAVTLATTAAVVLDLLPPLGWIVLLALAVALGVVAVATYVREGRSSSQVTKIDPREELKAQLAEVDSVRIWLSLREDPDERLPLDQDRVFQWAKQTYRLIQKEFPADADAFMGHRDAPLGSAYFATAYALRREQMGRDGYLESRADMVREILRAT